MKYANTILKKVGINVDFSEMLLYLNDSMCPIHGDSIYTMFTHFEPLLQIR